MLLLLISIVVLIATGFYALSVSATGRITPGEGSELSVGSRAVALGVAFIAFGASYLIYSHQKQQDPGAPLSTAQVSNTSNPPESRNTMAEAPAADASGDEDSATEAPDEEPAPQTAAKPQALDEPEAEPAAEDDTLSASALALEAQKAAPRRAITPAMAAAPVAEETQTAAAEPAPPRPAEAAAARKSAPERNTRNTSRSLRRESAPLLLHVHNRLGRNQSREQLTLSIEGLPVADIEVDDSRPSVAVAVPLPRPGLLHYRLEGVSEDDGTTRLVGEGCIRVRDGARFAVRRKDGSQKVFLETTRVAG